MSPVERSSERTRASGYAAPLAAVVVLALTAWLLWDMASGGERQTRAIPVVVTPTSEPQTSAAPELEPPEASTVEIAEDGIPIKPPGSEHSSDDERMHPHPIDDTRRRIYRENNLNGAMMGAMNVGDYQGLRALVEEYRMDYPEDTYRLQEGYTLIADCMEQLTPERQARAREYWKTKRGSTVRRFVRRHCLEREGE